METAGVIAPEKANFKPVPGAFDLERSSGFMDIRLTPV
jgi:hypothetical protein